MNTHKIEVPKVVFDAIERNDLQFLIRDNRPLFQTGDKIQFTHPIPAHPPMSVIPGQAPVASPMPHVITRTIAFVLPHLSEVGIGFANSPEIDTAPDGYIVITDKGKLIAARFRHEAAELLSVYDGGTIRKFRFIPL